MWISESGKPNKTTKEKNTSLSPRFRFRKRVTDCQLFAESFSVFAFAQTDNKQQDRSGGNLFCEDARSF